MSFSLSQMASFNRLEDNYIEFMQQSTIHSFRRSGGKVFIATEGLSMDLIQRWIELGHRHFSEKYVQETRAKWESRLQTPGLVLHHYGHLQSNKFNKALPLYDGLESVDSYRLLEKIALKSASSHRLQKWWVQVNLGSEPQKSGLGPARVDEFMLRCQELSVAIAGLMAIPPKGEPPSPYFKQLRELADRHQLKECIMGMSEDYNEAVERGATAIRIKRALLRPH